MGTEVPQVRASDIIAEIASSHGFLLETLEVSAPHVHVFLSFPPRYSIARVVGMLKGISASVIFEEHQELKKQLCGSVLGRRVFSSGRGD